MLRPILRLRNATLSASRGIFVPIRDEEGRKDEVADLVAAFNTGSKRREDRPFQKNRFSGNPGLWYCA
ncbi:MAG: hypothetical protein JRJ16_03495 [Deltaproteobacteria bacterium]|nr:hypothetical protein [Deltaproteobacteria bacterium]